MKTKCPWWIWGLWILCVGSSVTAKPWSDVKPSSPWGPWPPAVSQETYEHILAFSVFAVYRWTSVISISYNFECNSSFWIGDACLLCLHLEGDVKNALKKVDVIPSIVDSLSVEGECVFRSIETESLCGLIASSFLSLSRCRGVRVCDTVPGLAVWGSWLQREDLWQQRFATINPAPVQPR